MTLDYSRHCGLPKLPEDNTTIAALTYAQPYIIAGEYPIGTPVRTAIIESYMTLQRTLCIVGICICVPLIVFALLLRNPRLSEEQSQPEAEAAAEAHA